MIEALKKLLPPSLKARLRPWRQGLSEESQELLFLIRSKERDAKKSLLESLKTPEELFGFALEEFWISQNQTEILPFLELIANHRPQVVGEVGTYMAGNSFMFTRFFGEMQLLLAIDLKVKNRNKLRYYARPEQKIVCINGFSAVENTLNQVKKTLNGRKFDMVFIDGDHEYPGVKKDLMAYSQLVREGGLIAFHDIVPDDFVRYGKPGQYYSGDVYRLWRQLKKRFKSWEFIANPEQNGAGIGVILCDPQTQTKLQEIALLSKESE